MTPAATLGSSSKDCFCHEIEKNAAKAFDKVGLAAFERRVRARFDAAAEATTSPDGSTEGNPEYARRRWGDTLRTIYVAQRNVDAYVALAEETGLTAQARGGAFLD